MVSLPPGATEPEFVELFEYWKRKSPPGRLPGRQHIDPTEFSAQLLPYVLLIDVVAGEAGPRFKMRLTGTGFVQLVGLEVTGKFFDEVVPPDRGAKVAAAMQETVETAAPVFLEGPFTMPAREFLWGKRLFLPLAEDGKTVDMLLGAIRSVPRPQGTSGKPGAGE